MAQQTVPELLDKASRLDTSEFDSFFKAVLAMRARRVASVSTQQESELLEKIYAKLPAETLSRYALLTEKRRQETIKTEEYEELLQLVELVEQHNVDRLRHIVELAEMRQITAQQLMHQLGLMPLHHG